MVIVGRYPFCDPMLTGPTEDEGRAHLRLMLSSGVTAFVCLQAEIPPQSEYWPLDGVTLEVEHRGLLRDAGVVTEVPQAFLRYAGVTLDEAAKAGHPPPTFLHFPIKDMSVPTWEQLVCFLESMLLQLQDRGCLYVHCWGGMGRAGLL